ncbi:glycerophosphodiester phosphodiesterase [Halosolutus halophilus]|uniref:glycerophosphodiester phosphodiesterase n=1 Tax=Halosolutus halophilus TaxID=1552990 RepID=UPI0022350405|nr:glycerophosphodiester phosphodiesterase [Halosolutus halophilus]
MSLCSRPEVSRRRLLAGMGAGLSAVAVWGMSPLIGSGSVPADRPTIVGHRGAEGLAPPNTEAAIRRALDVGVDGVELDVRPTSDDELVLFHDPVLDWDSTGHGWIRNRPWDEIRGARIDGEPLITLDQALETIAPTSASIYLELKAGGYTDVVLETVVRHGLSDRVTIISFETAALDPAQEDGVSTGLVGSVPTPWLAEDAAAAGADVAFSHYAPHGVSTFVSDARDAGLTAGIWKLVDTKETIRDVLEHDLDILVTNRPDYAFDVLDAN